MDLLPQVRFGFRAEIDRIAIERKISCGEDDDPFPLVAMYGKNGLPLTADMNRMEISP